MAKQFQVIWISQGLFRKRFRASRYSVNPVGVCGFRALCEAMMACPSLLFALAKRPGFLRLHAFRGLHIFRSGIKVEQGGAVMRDRSGFKIMGDEVTSRGGWDFRWLSIPCVVAYRTTEIFETTSNVWLRSTWGLDGVCRFAWSFDGKVFEALGLFNYNNVANAGNVDADWFRYEYSGQFKP